MSKFRIIYPSTSGKILFDGGLNNKYERSIIADNESPDCLNVVFGAGSVGTRDGFVVVNTAAVGSFVCDGLYTRNGSNNAETMVAFFNGTGYTLNGTSFVTIGSAQSVFTAAIRVGSAQMENHIFFGNGGVTPYKYNGTDFTRHGVPVPTNTVSMNSNGAGNPNGDYRYKVAFINSQSVLGDVSTATSTFTVASKKILITSIPVAPQSHGVSSRRLYRTVTGGSTYKLLATISDNTTTTYDDDIADGSLGADAPTDQGEPPNYAFIVYHQNRLFMATGTDGVVWYTELNEPYTVKTTNFMTIGDQSSDFVKGLSVFGNELVIFGQRNPWIVYMSDTTPGNWKIVKSKSSYTSISPFGAFQYDNKLAFPAVQNGKFTGIAALSGDSVAPDATQTTISTIGSELKSERIEPDMFDIQESYLGNISSIVFKNKAYITMTKGSGQLTNNRIYVMDFSIENLKKAHRESWSPWSGLNAAQFTVYANALYFGASIASGRVWKQNPGVYSDNGTAINSYFWTKEFSGHSEEESLSKDFRYSNILVDLAGAYYMGMAVRTDSDSGDGTVYQVDLDPNASLWGTMVWGVDSWGAGASQRDIREYLAGARGKRIQFKFSNLNTVGQRFKVHWQNFTYNTKGPR